MKFKVGVLDDVLAQIMPIVRRTREEVGNISFDVWRARDDRDVIIILERWRDQAALEQHWQEPYTKDALAIFDANLSEPLQEAQVVIYLEDVIL